LLTVRFRAVALVAGGTAFACAGFVAWLVPQQWLALRGGGIWSAVVLHAIAIVFTSGLGTFFYHQAVLGG
jgi:hypothetical protein